MSLRQSVVACRGLFFRPSLWQPKASRSLQAVLFAALVAVASVGNAQSNGTLTVAALHRQAEKVLHHPELETLRATLAPERALMQRGIHVDKKTGKEFYTGYSYNTLFDWDPYFETIAQIYMGMGTERSENGVLMFLNRQEASGFIPRDIPRSPEFPAEGDEHAKPFFAQIALLDIAASGSDKWLDDEHFARIGRAIDYWQNQMDSNHDGLSEWLSGPHSGMDTQRERLGLWGARISEGVDINAYLVREMRAYAILAKLRGRAEVAAKYDKRADALRDRMRSRMWDEKDGWYYDINLKTGKPIRVKSVASFAVLWAGVATPEQAKRMVYEHLLNAREFWSNYPVPGLARSEPGYSEPPLPGDVGGTWRANTWVATNYMLYHSLRDYGFGQIASVLGYDTERMVRNAGSCEDYGSESGRCMGLHPFWGWSMLGYFFSFEEKLNAQLVTIGFSARR